MSLFDVDQVKQNDPVNISVVVVDDESASASAIGRLLEQEGCRVEVLTDPVSGLSSALASGVDLVTLDLRMPRLDGYELLSLIRSHEHSRRAPSVPVIAITGSVTDEAKAAAVASGFAAHLGKPVLIDELRRVLENVTALRSQLYRARYTADAETVAGRIDHLLSAPDRDAAQALAGLALALEQQGTELLRQMLGAAYAGSAARAHEAASRLAEVGDAIGAAHFAVLCRGFGAATGDRAAAERQAVLARAELDRVVYTLRERVLP